ncbi:MAG: hypothetical protein NVSMB64_07600 [Candidatus Velthaea sp.]
MEPQKTAAFFAAERQLRERESVSAAEAIDEAFAMQMRPSTIETWLGDNHAAGN